MSAKLSIEKSEFQATETQNADEAKASQEKIKKMWDEFKTQNADEAKATQEKMRKMWDGLKERHQNATSEPQNSTKVVQKDRFLMQHVWKCGGTELCRLARANGWNLPDTPGCTKFIHPHQGWPKEDYDMIGNEGAVPSGEVDHVYKPKKAFLNNADGRLSIENVKWLTVLRHPYSRTLSQYQHVHSIKAGRNLTLEAFLSSPRDGGGFAAFIDNQQTRWHCGLGICVDKWHEFATEEMLQHAMHNLDKMDAVLILEEMSSPNSCTRRQMRHVLKFKRFETLLEANKNDSTTEKMAPRRSNTHWGKVIRPYLDDTGRSSNVSLLEGFGVAANRSSSAITMSALGMHNDMDMQLYGYARHLCQILADKYDREANSTIAGVMTVHSSHATSTTHNATGSNVPESSHCLGVPNASTIQNLCVVIAILFAWSRWRRR